MPTLAIRFPAGRYHATPWYRHVNEGAIEWPPSPWRLLRALLAVGFAKRRWAGVPDRIPPEARRMLLSLASVRPRFRLPAGGTAHTRHYMPVVEGRSVKTTKVLDTFLRLADPNDPLLVHWPTPLDAEAGACLEDLAAGLAYLGRAESWIDACVCADPGATEDWVSPHVSGSPVPPESELVPLLAPLASEAYARWRDRELAGALEAAGRLTPGKQAALQAAFPADLLTCLCVDTAAIQKTGWSQPPGTERVQYLRRQDALEPSVARPRLRRTPCRSVEAALLTLTSDSTHGQLRPLVSRALPHMERLHDAAVRKCDGRSPAITGRDAVTREPLRGHRHAHWLPFDLDADGRIDHVLVYVPMLLDDDAQRALARIERTWGKNLPEIVVSLAGFGSLAAIRRQWRDRQGRVPPLLDRSAVWESVSPFVAPRHLKPRGPHTLEGQVRAECASRGLPEPVRVDVMPRAEMVRRGFFESVRSRTDILPPHTAPWALRLTFAEPLDGPLCLGYAAHFGLGLFGAVRS